MHGPGSSSTHRSLTLDGNSRDGTRGGFTLLEMLIVIGLVALLVGLSAMVGSSVINSGKKKATFGVIQTLDTALAAYIDQKGTNPPALVEIPYAELSPSLQTAMSNESAFYPAIDGSGGQVPGDLSPVNSVALFLKSASVVPQAQSLISAMNSKYVSIYSADENVMPSMLTVFDAWGNPIRYVHPKFDGIIEDAPRALGDEGDAIDVTDQAMGFFVAGALPGNPQDRVRMYQIRRNRLIKADRDTPDLVPDSDGGLTSGNRPYFYSAGPDGDPSTLEDNVYSNAPDHADPGVN